MTIASMRAVDRYLGVFLCWVTGIPKFLLRSEVPPPLPRRPGKVLIIKFFGLGSIILTTPALSLLRESYPELRIEYLTFERNVDLLRRYPFVGTIHRIRTSSATHFVRDTLGVIGALRSARYDAVFDFEFFSKFSTLLSSFSGARIRVGFSLPARWRSMHLTHQVALKRDEHVAKAFCRQVFLLCGERELPAVSRPVVSALEERSLVDKLPLNGHPIIIMNVNAGDTFIERRWPPGRFAALVRQLAAKLPHDFYFTGIEEERVAVDEVIEASDVRARCYNIAGMLSIGELTSLFGRSDLLISSDSGPVHLASAVGLRSIALFGPETPAFYGGLGVLSTSVTKSISCSPCMNIYAAKSFQCPYDARCMKAIEIADVRRLVEGVFHSV